MRMQTTLVATLGGQPQIITFLMDLLHAQGHSVDQVVLVYPGGAQRYIHAYRKVAEEFSGDYYGFLKRPCHLRAVPLSANGALLEECCFPAEIEATREAFQDLLSGLKDAGQTIHLGLSGGRRMLSILAVEVAMRYLQPTDHLWHIYTPPDWTAKARDGALMHLPPAAGLQLIGVPFMPWGALFPGLRPLLERAPQQALNPSLILLNEADRRRCARVWQRLTPRQKDALVALAEGADHKQAAQKLGVMPSTIASHRDAIVDKCEQVWQADALLFDPRWLQSKFGPFLKDPKFSVA